jgi:hypothetical protein
MDPARRQRLAFAALGALVLVAPLLAPNEYIMGVIARICLYALLALGLNVVVGFAGLLDIGYVAFFGIGSYAYAFLASPHFGIHLPFLVALPIVVATSALARSSTCSWSTSIGRSTSPAARAASSASIRRRSPASSLTTMPSTISCFWRSSRSPC